MGCVGCSDENANDPFSDINWGSEIESPDTNESTGAGDTSKEDDSNNSSTDDEDSSSEEDKDWTGFY